MKKLILCVILLVLILNFSNVSNVYCETYLKSIDVESTNFDLLAVECKSGNIIYIQTNKSVDIVGNWYTGNLEIIDDSFLLVSRGYIFNDGYDYFTGENFITLQLIIN